MNNNQFDLYKNIPDSKFEIVKDRELHDLKLDTKPVGYFKDAFRRFCKNKASVVASIIIIFLLIFSFTGTYISNFTTSFYDLNVSFRNPKSKYFTWLGWDGTKTIEIGNSTYAEYIGVEKETEKTVITKVENKEESRIQFGALNIVNVLYTVKLDTYTNSMMKFIQVTNEEYQQIQQYQNEHNVQIIYPALPSADTGFGENANLWYKVNTTGTYKNMPLGYNGTINIEDFEYTNNYIAYDGTDNYTSTMRLEGETPLYNYSKKVQGGNYYLRVDYNEYFEFKNGVEPIFLFGTDQYGKDIFVRLAAGARFSLLFALCISAINLTIGAIYGAIEGYFGGVADLIMERISDILSGVPFMVVVTLFKLHFASKVGVVPTLLFAFVMTGWIGMASNTRMQFYRYKNQEYVLAARTLGAKDFRIMFKHIFPNALGTLITSCVLVIPGVIFSESSLSYLGIVNLSTGATTSVGTLMANGQGYLSTYPHIILFPAIFIALLMITFNLFGNGLRDAFNPSLRGAED